MLRFLSLAKSFNSCDDFSLGDGFSCFSVLVFVSMCEASSSPPPFSSFDFLLFDDFFDDLLSSLLDFDDLLFFVLVSLLVSSTILAGCCCCPGLTSVESQKSRSSACFSAL